MTMKVKPDHTVARELHSLDEGEQHDLAINLHVDRMHACRHLLGPTHIGRLSGDPRLKPGRSLAATTRIIYRARSLRDES